jgi:hypothetical protein
MFLPVPEPLQRRVLSWIAERADAFWDDVDANLR